MERFKKLTAAALLSMGLAVVAGAVLPAAAYAQSADGGAGGGGGGGGAGGTGGEGGDSSVNQEGDNDAEAEQQANADSGDIVAGQVIGAQSSGGNININASNHTENVDAKTGDANASNNADVSAGNSSTGGDGGAGGQGGAGGAGGAGGNGGTVEQPEDDGGLGLPDIFPDLPDFGDIFDSVGDAAGDLFDAAEDVVCGGWNPLC
jgi:hypothetical protein